MAEWCSQDEDSIFFSFQKEINNQLSTAEKISSMEDFIGNHGFSENSEFFDINQAANEKSIKKRDKLLVWMGSSLVEKGTAEYEKRRKNNNEAVKRCRKKWLQKQYEKEERLKKLEDENEKLMGIIFKLKRQIISKRNANSAQQEDSFKSISLEPIKLSQIEESSLLDEIQVIEEFLSKFDNNQMNLSINNAVMREENALLLDLDHRQDPFENLEFNYQEPNKSVNAISSLTQAEYLENSHEKLDNDSLILNEAVFSPKLFDAFNEEFEFGNCFF